MEQPSGCIGLDQYGRRCLGHGSKTPRMNAIAGRRIGGCRRELLDRILIWNQNHLRQVLRQYESHHNEHRPHRSLDAAVPLKPLPQPVVLEQHRVRRTRVSDTIHEYRLVAYRGGDSRHSHVQESRDRAAALGREVDVTVNLARPA
jgi:putative transposase